ncbi:MAG: hypothetical protein D6731_10400, partial [Planctomycetota bacterium]
MATGPRLGSNGNVDFSSEFYRFAAALAVGALVGFERQSRLETPPEEWQAGDEPPPSPEDSIRAAVAAGESTRWSAATLRRDADPTTTESEAPRTRQRPFVPDFEQAVGLRTFILVSLSGALAGTVSRDAPWVFVACFLVLGTLVALSYHLSAVNRGDYGLTSEVSAVAVFLLGGLCAQGQVELAGAAAIVITFTLSLKQGLHRLAQKIRKDDIQAVLKFAVLTFIVLPLLPTEPIPVVP